MRSGVDFSSSSFPILINVLGLVLLYRFYSTLKDPPMALSLLEWEFSILFFKAEELLSRITMLDSGRDKLF